MSNKITDNEQKKQFLKDVILNLHKGLSFEDAKNKIEKEIGEITTAEIAEVEQALINDGVSTDEIKNFCNVHALLFKASMAKNLTDVESPSHPVYLFKLENREIEKITKSINDIISKKEQIKADEFRDTIKNDLIKLKEVNIHYTRKEQLLFPFLEKYGFFGPSKVMWGKDNDIRSLLKKALVDSEKISDATVIDSYIKDDLNPLIEEVDGMIFKEENILFPSSLEKLKSDDWVSILEESAEIGYAFIPRPKDVSLLIEEFKTAAITEAEIDSEKKQICFPTGNLSLDELLQIFNNLPVDLTFVDKNDEVRYFSDNCDRIFVRTKAVIGRKVQMCHPPQSVDIVEKILKSFKEGRKDHADFWINLNNKLVYIRYFAIRDQNKNYLGTLEVTQDITQIKSLEGERRLLSEGN